MNVRQQINLKPKMMTDNKQILRDWLAATRWQPAGDLEIPAPVLEVLRSFLTTEHADDETLAFYRDTLVTLFHHYRKSAYTNKALLGDALVKLGTFSIQQFWPAAEAYLSMDPDSTAIARWVNALHLSADAQRSLETERFHALR